MPLRLGALTRKEVCEKPPSARVYGILNYEMSLSHFFRGNPLAGSVTAAMCLISNLWWDTDRLERTALLPLFARFAYHDWMSK